MAFRIEVLPDNGVRIYKDSDTVPFLFQPTYPNNDVFESNEEAQAWAEMFVEGLEDPNALMAPFGKGAERLPKPQPEA